jgi:hypothetical protein
MTAQAAGILFNEIGPNAALAAHSLAAIKFASRGNRTRPVNNTAYITPSDPLCQ